MMIANSIVVHNKTQMSINVEDSLEGVLGGLNKLIEITNNVSTKDFEIIWEEMLEIREKRKQKNKEKEKAKENN